MSLNLLLARFVASGMTLYMLLILIRWLGSYLELDFYDSRLRWIPRAVDPLLRIIRKTLPPLGPFDAGPVLALLGLWLVRECAVRILPPSML